jgi:hypothetical protein
LILIVQLVQKWNDEVIASDPSGRPLIDLVVWLSRATLDVIGEGVGPFFRSQLCLCSNSPIAGFDYQFGSLDNIKTALAEQYDDLL